MNPEVEKFNEVSSIRGPQLQTRSSRGRHSLGSFFQLTQLREGGKKKDKRIKNSKDSQNRV